VKPFAVIVARRPAAPASAAPFFGGDYGNLLS
jgi:hypothetical protein